jgi:transposase
MTAADSELIALRADNRLLRVQLDERAQEAHDLRAANDELTAKVGALEQRLVRMTKRIFGWSSERRSHPDQQRIALEFVPAADSDVALGGGLVADHLSVQASVPTSAPSAQTAAAPKRKPRAPGSHPGRRCLPADTEVILPEPITLPEHERLDEHGQPLPLLGYRTTDLWDFRPGAYVIRRLRRAIYGRPFSDADARVVAAMPQRLIPGGKMTDAAVIHTVVEKFADHLPLYRQEQRANRQGIHLSRSTLLGHVTAVATAMEPIYQALISQVRDARYVHLDDTPVKLLSPGLGHAATGRIWVYRSEQATVFQCTETREGRHPEAFLAGYRGYIVADAYAGHNGLYGPERATPISCWAHVRRKFHELMNDQPLALRLVEDIGEIYRIERDLALVDDDVRRQSRMQRALPRIAAIEQCLRHSQPQTTPGSALGKAITYALNRWPHLTTYTTQGFLPIDNNPAENALRPWAIGRKNWLFFGSLVGGQRAAVIATLIDNCRRQGIDPFIYLLDTAAALHRGATDYHDLTPLASACRRDLRTTA